MSRDRLLIYGALALLLLFGAWYFTVATAEAGLPSIVAPLVFSITSLAASSLVFRLGLRTRISGLLVVATTLSGIGLLGIGHGLAPRGASGAFNWLLLPAFIGFGILIENRLGIGWRFSNWQAVGLIAAGIGFYILARSIFGQETGEFLSLNSLLNLSIDELKYSTNINQAENFLPLIVPFVNWRC